MNSDSNQPQFLTEISKISTSKKRKAIYEEQKNKRICSINASRGLPNSSIDETEYFFENHLRKVYPYYFTYTTHCKGRWAGKRLIDVFSEEFRAHSVQEYEKSIAAGNIKINDKNITVDYIFKGNDRVTNKTHRHETAVAAASVRVIHSDDDFFVVDKPPSVPVHPCGRYRHNCLLFILAKEHDLKELYSVHRLDRLTSGVLLFTKTIKKSQEINEQIRERKVKKEYVCRVEGKFPDGIVSCSESLEVISPKVGVCIVSPSGKDCETIFERMSYNGISSVVRCEPRTGRMHQIRVHLQYLGYPIINDPIYNNETIFGKQKGKLGHYGKSKDDLLDDILNTNNLQKWLLDDNVSITKCEESKISHEYTQDLKERNKNVELDNKIALSALDYYLKDEKCQELAKKYIVKPEKFVIEETCDLCHQKYMDPQPRDLILFLHALKYEGEGWSFSSELPSWAQADWSEATFTL